jgi:hypothetical protein
VEGAGGGEELTLFYKDEGVNAVQGSKAVYSTIIRNTKIQYFGKAQNYFDVREGAINKATTMP